MFRRKYDSFVGLLMCACCLPAAAEFPAASISGNAPAVGTAQESGESYAGESDDVGPQVALAVKPARMHVEVGGDMQYYHTSNLYLTEDSPNPSIQEDSAGILLTTVNLAVAPDPTALGEGEFQPRLGYRHQWYTIDLEIEEGMLPPDVSRSLDFYTQTLFAEARYRYHRHWLIAGGVEWTQMSKTNGDSNIYTEVVPRLSVQRLFKLDDTRLFTAGYKAAYHATTADAGFSESSDRNDRIDQGLFANYTQALTPQLFLQPYYQYQYTRYPDNFPSYITASRHDNLHSVGTTLSYYFVPEISLRAFANYDVNDSSAPENANTAIYDYKKLDAGIGLNANYRF